MSNSPKEPKFLLTYTAVSKPFKALQAEARAFITDRRGGYTAIMVVILPLLLVAVGASIDLARTYTIRGDLERAVEAASLAAASLTQKQDPDVVARDYIASNFSFYDDPNIDVAIDVELLQQDGARAVTVAARTEVNTMFIHLLGVSSLVAGARATSEQASLDVEISMVLDTSSSMDGARIRRLKAAAQEFVDIVTMGGAAEQTTINLVPFADTVNLGPVFQTVATPLAGATLNPGSGAYTDVLNGRWRFTPPYVPSNCAEVPFKYFETPQPPFYALGQISGAPLGMAALCPRETNSVLLNTGDLRSLERRISGLRSGGETGMDIGAYWGWQFLRPEWRGRLGGRFPDRPTDLHGDTIKVMIIMTDGEITGQSRLTPLPMVPSVFELLTQRREVLYPQGSPRSSRNSKDAVANFRKVCDQAKKDEIIVYTIGFMVRDGLTADTILAECASTPSNYIQVQSLNIEEAFYAIAAHLTTLRISG